MTPEVLRSIAALHASSKPRNTLLVDEPVAWTVGTCLAALGVAPDEMWSMLRWGDEKFTLAVVSAPRPARELYRVLAGLERLVAVGGSIVIAPYDTGEGFETRAEATEIFCGVYLAWERSLLDGNVVRLQKCHEAFVLGKEALTEGQVAFLEHTPAIERERVLRQGKGIPSRPFKRVVSLSVFNDHRDGPADGLWASMPAFVTNYVLAHHTLFGASAEAPAYELRVHHDEHLYHANGGDVLCALARQGLVTLVYVPSRPGQGKAGHAEGKCLRMLHRLMPAWDPEVAYVFCRDVDSIPTWRDRQACEEFIASGCAIGTVHDNPAHVGIMGGLCHVDAVKFRHVVKAETFGEFIAMSANHDAEWATHGADQNFLNAVVDVSSISVLEHSLVEVVGEGGVRTNPRTPTWFLSDFRKTLAVPSQAVTETVPEGVRWLSNTVINYLGASGYRTEDARRLYDRVAPQVVCDAVIVAETCAPTAKKRVVLAVDDNPAYAFYLPLTCKLWARRGYRPLVVLVGTAAHWLGNPQLRIAVERAREAGAELYWTPNREVLSSNREVQGARSSTVAQCARIFGALLPHVTDEDYLITSDMDMWPLGEWVGAAVRSDDNSTVIKPITSWFINAYRGSDYFHVPMCYVGTKAVTWRALLAQTADDRRVKSFDEMLSCCLRDAPSDVSGAWNWDERYLGRLLEKNRDFLQGIDRDMNASGQWRLDRSQWAEGIAEVRRKGTLEGIADAHLPKYSPDAWEALHLVLSLSSLSTEDLVWADAYHEAWEKVS